MPDPVVPRSRPKRNRRAAAKPPAASTARQVVRLARKTQSLDVLYEIATSLNQPGSLETLLGNFLDTFIELVDARAASVRMVEPDGSTRMVASRGLAAEAVERDRLVEKDRCHCGWVSAGSGIRVGRGTELCTNLLGRPLLEPDCVEFVAVPVQYQERVLGVYNLFLDRPLSAMGEDIHDLLISVGRHLGLAFEKARFEGEARRLAVMEERLTIGHELHDSLAQSLVGMRLRLKMLSEALERRDVGTAQYEARGLQRAMTRTNAELRSLLANYRLKIDEAGFARTVENLIERFRDETGIAVFFQNDCNGFALTPAQEIQVYYIIQEALTNVRRHASAHNVRVLLANEEDLYTVLVEDDGLGMSPGAGGRGGEHAGMEIMRERTARLPGQIVVESEPGEGTRIVLIFNAPPPVSAGG